MGHNICHRSYPENVDKKKVSADLNHYIEQETWQEGGHGLVHPIRWLDSPICESYEEATQFLEKNDRGDYDSLAVRYKDWPKGYRTQAPSKKMAELRAKYNELTENYSRVSKTSSIHNRKSEYIGCPNCGSSLKLSLVSGENCPLCKTDLRSATNRAKLESILGRINVLNVKLQEQYDKDEKSRRKDVQPDIQWLVKFEYHT